MKESYRKDLATHPDPESCDSGRKATGEALTGAHAGQPSSCVITVSGVPTLSTQAEGNTVGGATGKPSAVEPVAEGVDRDLSTATELDVGQAGPVEVGDDCGPVDGSAGLGHEVGSRRDGSHRPILPISRSLLNMQLTGRLVRR